MDGRHRRERARLAAGGCDATPAEALVVCTAEGEPVAMLVWMVRDGESAAVVYPADGSPRRDFGDVAAAVDAVLLMAGPGFDEATAN